ncbi:MAG: small subunit ribosomal protein ispH, lytB [Clostridia bacterium]|nr:small subunit ribosomal protein ispH, lytB [Clostridia bacterium]
MEVIVAEHAGFCYGVKRAADKATNASKPVASLGSLVHNQHVVDKLTKEGVYPVKSMDEVDCERVLIRSHGVPPNILSIAREKGLEIIDATCPYVARAQKLAQKLSNDGYQVIIIGEADHPEVKGLLGWAGPNAIVISNKKMAMELPFNSRRAVLVQTTQPESLLAEVVGTLCLNTYNLVIHNTICQATRQRQEAAINLARQVDVMVVVGGKNSANTRHLVELCRTTGKPTYHIERAEELCDQWFINAQRVGVTAGASTPAWIIEEVVAMLSEQEKAMVDEKEQVEMPEAANEQEAETNEVTAEAEGGVEAPAANGEPQATGQEQSEMQEMTTTMPELRRGSIIAGKVVQINDNEVLVDVGGKSEGVISLTELTHRNINDPHEVVSVGDNIDVMVLRPENEEGHPVLSKRRADRRVAWQNLEEKFAKDEEIQGEVMEVVKGGLLVDVGVRGFVPASLVERGYVEDLSTYVGKTLRLKVIELDRGKNKIVLSRKAILDKEYEEQREATWNELEVGQVRKGIVRRLTNFGAFVDLGGVDGLLHVSEISWGRVEHPKDVLSEGEEIEVKVLGINREEGKVSLGLKQLISNPWNTAAERYPIGTVVEGKVLRIAPFGAFVEVEPGIEGLVHISQMANKHVEKPEDVVSIGDTVPVKVLGVDQDAQRMSLSMRQANNENKPKKAAPKQVEKPQVTTGESGVKLGDLFGDLFEENKGEN